MTGHVRSVEANQDSVLKLLYNVICIWLGISGLPRNFFRGGSTNSAEDIGQREWGSGSGSPLVRGCGGSCNFVQEFHFI